MLDLEFYNLVDDIFNEYDHACANIWIDGIS